MVKEKANLKQAVPSLLAALDQIIAHPSKTEDTGSIIQTGIHLAQRTMKTFSGSHQWSMPLMASALLGNKSIVSLELFRYVFPHANVSYMNSLIKSDSNLCHDECAKSSHSMDENNEYAQSCLDAVMEAVVWEMRRGVSKRNCEWAGGTPPPLFIFCVGQNAPFRVWIGV
jgi:hypothetical protein